MKVSHKMERIQKFKNGKCPNSREQENHKKESQNPLVVLLVESSYIITEPISFSAARFQVKISAGFWCNGRYC